MSEASREPGALAPGASPGRFARRLLPLALLVAFTLGKLDLDPVALDERQADGLFYYQIAQHVAAGEGLLTSVSLYAQGLRELPAPTTVQPLWPLLLGWTGRVVGLDRAAAWLPEAFYLASLILLYALANRIGRSLGAEVLVAVRGVPVVDLGSVALAILGANSVYRAYTSLAYSEGLAMTLLFGALLALPGPGAQRVLRRAALAGVLTGFAYLARSQLVLVPLALCVTLVLCGRGQPALRRSALVYFAAALAPVASWLGFLLVSLGPVSPGVLVDFSAHHETEGLPEFALRVSYDGVLDRVLDFLASFAVALDPTHLESYFTSFGPVIYAVPLALGLLAWRALRGAAIEPWFAGALHRDRVPVIASLLAGAAALAPVHAAHMAIWLEWHFSWRHGIPLVLMLVPAIALLARSGWAPRAVVLVAVIVGVLAPATRPANYIVGTRRPTWPAEQSLMRWLDEQPGRPVLLGTMARSLAARSRAVAHQLECGGPERVGLQLDLLPVDYLVVYATDLRSCPALAELGSPEFVRVKRFGRGGQEISVLAPSPGGPRPAPRTPTPPGARLDADLDTEMKSHPDG